MMGYIDTATIKAKMKLNAEFGMWASQMVLLNVQVYDPIKLLSVALIKLNADAEYHENMWMQEDKLKYYRNYATFMADKIDDMCSLVFADKELVIAMAKALKRRKRRYGIDFLSYKLTGRQINSLCAFFSGYMVI